MPRVLVIHHDKSTRSHLEDAVRTHYEVEGAVDVVAGAKQLRRRRPDAIVIGQDREKNEALRLLKYMQDNVLKIPTVVVLSRGAGAIQPALMKLGAKGILESPVDRDRLNKTLAAAIAAASVKTGPPPLTEEELNSNLSMLERKLNREMRCFAGRNQVYIQSMIGRGAPPRISLKCNLRAEYGLGKDVYYEFVRDVCCGDPSQCEAFQRFQADQRETA